MSTATASARDLIADLTAVAGGRAEAGTRRRAEYSSDSSNYRVVPDAEVCPRDADEVADILDVARTHGRSRPGAGGRPSPATRSDPGSCSTSPGT